MIRLLLFKIFFPAIKIERDEDKINATYFLKCGIFIKSQTTINTKY